MISLPSLILAAQAGGNLPPGAGAPPIQQLIVPIAVFLGVSWLMFSWNDRRSRNRRQAVLNDLKKNDRVMTTSGMLGVVAAISPDGREVTLKFSDNTRIAFVRSAILEIRNPDGSESELANTATVVAEPVAKSG